MKIKTKLGGGFNQPIWKICSSNWIMKPPGFLPGRRSSRRRLGQCRRWTSSRPMGRWAQRNGQLGVVKGVVADKLPLFGRLDFHCWVFPKIGVNTPKMDGENNGKPYEQMDDFGGKHHYFRKHPYIIWEKLFFFCSWWTWMSFENIGFCLYGFYSS